MPSWSMNQWEVALDNIIQLHTSRIEDEILEIMHEASYSYNVPNYTGIGQTMYSYLVNNNIDAQDIANADEDDLEQVAWGLYHLWYDRQLKTQRLPQNYNKSVMNIIVNKLHEIRLQYYRIDEFMPESQGSGPNIIALPSGQHGEVITDYDFDFAVPDEGGPTGGGPAMLPGGGATSGGGGVVQQQTMGDEEDEEPADGEDLPWPGFPDAPPPGYDTGYGYDTGAGQASESQVPWAALALGAAALLVLMK